MTIPGAGVVTASALVSSMRDPADFKSGRHFPRGSDWCPSGIPRVAREQLGSIGKRGNGYLRKPTYL
jgi:transposase